MPVAVPQGEGHRFESDTRIQPPRLGTSLRACRFTSNGPSTDDGPYRCHRMWGTIDDEPKTQEGLWTTS